MQKTNRHYDQVIQSFELRSETTLTDLQKHILGMELEALVVNVLNVYWSNEQDANRKSREEFTRDY